MNARVHRPRRPASGQTVLVAFAFTVAGCLACTSGFENVQSENRAKLYLLEPGQTREQVLEEMGTEPQEYNRGVFRSSGIVPNPYSAESHVVRGDSVEIFYYATHIKNTDGMITDDELTPLVLVNDVLVGWGWSYLNAFVEQNEVPIAGPQPPEPADDS